MVGIEINNTTKSGWISLFTNNYYKAGNDHKEIYDRIENVTIDVIDLNGSDVVEIYIKDDAFYLTTPAGVSSPLIMEVNNINGTTPTTTDELRDLILALL